ncbi:MAG TPA: hypothetical protein VFG33_27410 [Kribbella sp.]|uniref:hypothetical protein n=1 Tax=Kribbella sp. TaxID=1871183 RepID=UPI002D76A9AC|nr:hypothetical protein [Kribbella sp.]HET6297144.1 hypothetical protein [Kribbella sp.]
METGRPVRNLDTLAYWARVLEIPVDLLWFDLPGASRAAESATDVVLSVDGEQDSSHLAGKQRAAGEQRPFLVAAPFTPGEEEGLERRRLLESLAGLGAMAALGVQPLEVIRHALNASLPPDGSNYTIEDWQEIAYDYAHAYSATPPQLLLPDLIADVLALRHAINETADSRRRSHLYAAGATLATIMAMTASALSQPGESRQWWRTGRRAADASGDRDLRVWVRGYESMSGFYQGRPLQSVLNQADAAIQLAEDHASIGKLQAMACKAKVLSQMGATADAEDLLGQMRSTFDSLPGTVAAERSSLLAWPEQNLLHTDSFVYTATGRVKEAHKSQDAALAAYPMSMSRCRAQIELHRAACLVNDGSVTDGIAHAGYVLEGLPAEHHTQNVRAVARKVLATVPDSEAARPSVSEYRELLSLSHSPGARQSAQRG